MNFVLKNGELLKDGEPLTGTDGIPVTLQSRPIRWRRSTLRMEYFFSYYKTLFEQDKTGQRLITLFILGKSLWNSRSMVTLRNELVMKSLPNTLMVVVQQLCLCLRLGFFNIFTFYRRKQYIFNETIFIRVFHFRVFSLRGVTDKHCSCSLSTYVDHSWWASYFSYGDLKNLKLSCQFLSTFQCSYFNTLPLPHQMIISYITLFPFEVDVSALISSTIYSQSVSNGQKLCFGIGLDFPYSR